MKFPDGRTSTVSTRDLAPIGKSLVDIPPENIPMNPPEDIPPEDIPPEDIPPEDIPLEDIPEDIRKDQLPSLGLRRSSRTVKAPNRFGNWDYSTYAGK